MPGSYLPPFCQIAPNDHGGWVAVVTGVGLCCTLVALMIRAFVRVVISPPFGRDDTAILLATVSNSRWFAILPKNRLIDTKVIATIQSSVILYGVSKGLGRSVELISSAETRAVEKVDLQTSSFCALTETFLPGCLRQ